MVQASVAGLLALVVVGPAFGSGVVLAYDLVWSPDPRFTPYALGTAGLAPRAVPSDVVAITLGHLLGAGFAQALVLWGSLVLAGTGAARLAALLAADLGLMGRAVSVVAAVWNPFVLERLVIGHWTVLLGYAAVPHLLVSCVRVRRGERPVWSPAVGLAACGIGGANSLVVCVPAVFVALAGPPIRWRALAYSVASTLGVSFVWALPAITARVTSAPEGVAAFAARSDTPLGVVGSLVTGGGLWNSATHPTERGIPLLAVVSVVLTATCVLAAFGAARRERLLVLLVPGVLGLGLAWLSSADPFGLWSALVLHVPGGGVLRDAQKLIAPWVVVTAAGCGVLAGTAVRIRPAGPPVAVLLACLPVALLPSLAWGVGSRVSAVEVPTDVRAVAQRLSEAGPGAVGLIPWSQYRRYAWNDKRVSLTLVPRMVDHRVVFNDSLPLTAGTVAGEDPVARRVTGRIADGATPLAALTAEGVRWVVVEKRAGGDTDAFRAGTPNGARVVHDSPNVLVVEVAERSSLAERGAGWEIWLGWAMTCITWIAAAACLGRNSLRRRSDRLVGSAP